MPHLQVHAADVSGVWHVRLPHWPWQYGRAEEEREAAARTTALLPTPDRSHARRSLKDRAGRVWRKLGVG